VYIKENIIMTQKKVIIASVASLLMLAGSAAAQAYDGTVKFEGEIVGSACTVDIGANNTLTVNMGKVNKSAFTGAGSTASATKFTLKLKDCPSTVNGATVKFDGKAYEGDDSVLALTEESGVATGVGIQLADKSQNVLPLFTASTNYVLQSGVINNLDFYARYIAKADAVQAGLANAVATFTMNYN
jgi:major type 1 subunit fimbrin (pilin)